LKAHRYYTNSSLFARLPLPGKQTSGEMDLETSLYAFAWIGGFLVFLVFFGKLYR